MVNCPSRPLRPNRLANPIRATEIRTRRRPATARGARMRNSYLSHEWGNKETALQHLTTAGLILREDLSFAPPQNCKRLSPKQRRGIEYLVLNCGFIGLLTDAQHAERGATE